MADITIKFLNTDKNKELAVTLDDSYTANEIITELYKNKFIEPAKNKYYLTSQKDVIIDANKSLKDANIKTNDFIIVSAYSSNEGKMPNSKQEHQNPLIFISHDSRDAKLANLFAILLKSVSQNLLQTFCSSAYDIKYGANPFDQIPEKINEASDVVCLLTKNSLEKPWILYEAGLGKAKVRGVFGVAFGVSLKKITVSNPFSQFQNCNGKEDDLCELLKQLLTRTSIVNPDDFMIRSAVNDLFLKKAKPIIKNNDDDDISVDQLYKEIKNISKNLLDNSNISSQKLNYFLNYSFTLSGEWGFIFLLNLLRADYPWLYDIGFEIIRKRSELEKDELINLISDFKKIADFSISEDIYKTATSTKNDYISLLKQTINRIDLNKNKMIYLL